MSLYIPLNGSQRVEGQITTSTAEPGTLVTANATLHAKGSYTTLIAATAYTSYGITVLLSNTAVASARTGQLVDIAIGAAASEVVIIPNLMAGNQGTTGGATPGGGAIYYFPIIIPAGVRISARSQAFVTLDTVNVGVWLNQNPVYGKWYGSRVTAYGVASASSTGVSISPGNGSYTTGTIIASSTNPVKYLQLGVDLFTNTTGVSIRGLCQVLAASQIIANHLPFTESTTLESIHFNQVNMILSQMNFNLPAAINLSVGAMRNGTAATRGWALYGVD